ncbi:nucleotide exchange factor GrpE [Thiomicrorhabdus sediminis]|uniref:Protein GrpE n=1 Tax=Thiomicrorhabdus sediminis TaxID=2580412 RepID=A0A4P9K535_9GAMM|nr:nucleotide exchange factor GrpE [Thiomicrorhabdus sediminis]QCU89968.1 nucleotide exchange factor GrpE [Thiomicrorhabdus sediminis]
MSEAKNQETVNNENEAVVQPEEETLEQAQEAVEHDVEALLEEARAEAEKHKDMALRVQADMENLRRRTRMDVESAHKFALEKFVNALIPALDSMEMGIDAANKEDASIDSIREGLDMTFKQLLDVLGEFNVERVNPTGEKFDPQLHEAMTMVPSPDHESNTVIETFQKGYTLNERLVRAARVVVAQ